MDIPDSLYRSDHFQYRGKFYPLASADQTNYFNIEIHTTFGLRKTIIVNAEAEKSHLAKDELLGLSGFVAFDLEKPFDWQNLTGHRQLSELTDDDDVCICTDYHQFATKQCVEFMQQKDHSYRIKAAWVLEESPKAPATIDGWFSYHGVILYVDDKVFGAERRELIEKYGEAVPNELTQELDERIKASAWTTLCELSPDARTQYMSPSVMPGNICRFQPIKV